MLQEEIIFKSRNGSQLQFIVPNSKMIGILVSRACCGRDSGRDQTIRRTAAYELANDHELKAAAAEVAGVLQCPCTDATGARCRRKFVWCRRG